VGFDEVIPATFEAHHTLRAPPKGIHLPLGGLAGHCAAATYGDIWRPTVTNQKPCEAGSRTPGAARGPRSPETAYRPRRSHHEVTTGSPRGHHGRSCANGPSTHPGT
jgi:hypothetical protein